MDLRGGRHGVALLPLFLAEGDVASGRLVQPYSQTQRNEKAYYLVHETGAGRIRKVRLAKEWLRAEAQVTQHRRA